MLKQELGESASFAELGDYHPPNTLNPSFLALGTFLRSPSHVMAMDREHDFVRKLLMEEKVDAIFSDNRFGFYSRHTPSFFMTHQLRILNPLGLKILEYATEIYNRWFLKRCTGVLVPDFEEDGLAGRLDHDLSIINERKLNYIGVLSEFKYRPTVQDVDVFVSISGPEPQRTAFENLVQRQIDGFEGKVVMSLGKPEDSGQKDPNFKGFLTREEREEVLNRAKIVVARSGYSTLMDLCALRKKGLLIPTPGQVEQEYLAKYHMKRKTYYCVSEKKLRLQSQLDDALSYRPPRLRHSSEKAVKKAVDIITQTARRD
jgi:UDP-N-acetylglucosamine transferase subunit ALG13